jgi:SAM-dependent methyltransferase
MMEDIFLAIYQANLWGSQESRSGPGSTLARAADFLPDLVALLQALNTRVLLDAPCGDFNWASPLADTVERYIGVDVVGEIVARNQRVASTPTRIFVQRDLTNDPLNSADVILCRDCLVHFSFEDIWRALRNFQASGSRYLLTTTFVEHSENPDIRTGGWRPLNLERPPFSFPPPTAVVDERCLHSGGRGRDKRLALWELAAVPTAPRIADRAVVDLP